MGSRSPSRSPPSPSWEKGEEVMSSWLSSLTFTGSSSSDDDYISKTRSRMSRHIIRRCRRRRRPFCVEIVKATPSQHAQSVTPPKSQHQQEPESESELELDSPPRITIVTIPDEPDTPTSPRGGPPPSIDLKPRVLPTFGSDAEDNEKDPFFKSLVDSFIVASEDVCNSILPDYNADYQQKSHEYAVSALKHYNNEMNNKVKYNLISTIISSGVIEADVMYGHVNFTAKGNQPRSKEELFFAELRLDQNTYVPTCVLSLEGEKSIGGLYESKYDNFSFVEKGFPMDAQHCYACGHGSKHPKNGSLYKAGHVAIGGYYHG